MGFWGWVWWGKVKVLTREKQSKARFTLITSSPHLGGQGHSRDLSRGT